jgi:TonB family protein
LIEVVKFKNLEAVRMKHLFLVVALLLGVLILPSSAQEASLPREIKGGILNGKAVSLPKPEYPNEARAAGTEGTVYVNVVVDESGTVISAVASTETHKLTRSKGEHAVEIEVPPADPVLRAAAEKAALEARFSPTLLSGQPVKVTGTIIYNFVAENSAAANVGKVDIDVLNGKAVSLPKPAYPAAARAVKAEGVVSVKVVIDESGDVVSATAVSGHPLLRAAAVEAARAAKFSPSIVDGQTVKVAGILTYNFIGPKEDTN